MMRFIPLVLLAGCIEPGEYVYGDTLGDLEFELFSEDMGVHPDTSVMRDPNNPFRNGISAQAKFEVVDAGPIAGFYGWATSLAQEPTGEHQFFAAQAAHAIYDQRLADPEDLVFVREIAIGGYQNVLEEFPGAVTFSASGREQFPLGPQALLALEALGGDTLGWRYVGTPDGIGTVVKEADE